MLEENSRPQQRWQVCSFILRFLRCVLVLRQSRQEAGMKCIKAAFFKGGTEEENKAEEEERKNKSRT